MPVNICKRFTHTKQAALGIASIFLLCLGFYANTWKVAKEDWFGRFEHYSESLAVGRIVKSRQDGIFATGGLLGRGFPEQATQRYYEFKHSRVALIEYQYEAYIEGASFNTYTTYDSQTGGRAAFFSLLDKTLPQSSRAKLALFYGLCTSRCPAEICQYNIAILGRRLYGKYIAAKAEHLASMVKEVEKGKYEQMLRGLMDTDEETLKDLYNKREIEPEQADEDWIPKDKTYL